MDPRLFGFLSAAVAFTGIWFYLNQVFKPTDSLGVFRKSLWPTLYILLLVGSIGSIVIGFAVYTKGEWWAREEGQIEWLSFWLAVFAALGFGLAFSRSLRRVNLLTLALFGGAVFYAGEEISWGQHVFGVAVPEFFQESNSQKEITVHNLRIGGVYIGPYLQAGMPLVLAGLFFVGQRLFPTLVRRYAGFEFNRQVTVFALLVALFVGLGALPFTARVEANIPLHEIPGVLFTHHSFAFTECTEALFAFFLMVGGIRFALSAPLPVPQVTSDTLSRKAALKT